MCFASRNKSDFNQVQASRVEASQLKVKSVKPGYSGATPGLLLSISVIGRNRFAETMKALRSFFFVAGAKRAKRKRKTKTKTGQFLILTYRTCLAECARARAQQV
jgi:hypothetical protein